MTKFLDYEGLKIFATKLKNLISAAQTTANNAASSATTANTAAATAQKRADDAYKLASDINSDYVSLQYENQMEDAAKIVWLEGSTYIDNNHIMASNIQQKGYDDKHDWVMGTDGVPHQVYSVGTKIATLDQNDNIPLSCLGNLDTTLFEVVTALPTKIADIKKHIYLVKELTGANNQYTEYIYTGGIGASDTYDTTKWEKLGNFSANIDLSAYLKKTDAANTYATKSVAISNIAQNTAQSDKATTVSLTRTTASGSVSYAKIAAASTTAAGVMTAAMVTKLNGIAAGANAYTLPTASATVLGGVKVGANLVISSGVLNVEKISDDEIIALFT